MPLLDLIALSLFLLCWLFYEPALKAGFKGGVLNTHMTIVRRGWMQRMTSRDNRIMDGQLLGHTINSASFFASSNLLLIAATAGVLFGGERAFASASSLELIRTSSRMMFEVQLGLVLITLSRGLLDFIWSIRQLNYCVAVIGAAPEEGKASRGTLQAYADTAANLLTPALSSFNTGVRGYYFALAAAAWIFGAWTFMAVTAGAVCLLAWRQRRSKAARAIENLRNLLEAESRAGTDQPS